MDYLPRYPQPFTLAEAIALDVSVITEEIARLQNSLQHLRQTQDTLREYVASEKPEDVDPEITKALEENKDVIASQEERISILKMALTEKGVHAGSHYDLAPLPEVTARAEPGNRAPTQGIANSNSRSELDTDGLEDGVYL